MKMNSIEKREESENIMMRNDMTPDQKLFVISQLYKEELHGIFPFLHYAFLGWKDSHLKELWSKEVVDCLESFKFPIEENTYFDNNVE